MNRTDAVPGPDATPDLRQHLEHYSQALEDAGWVRGILDVTTYVLAHGQAYQGAARPKGVRRRPAKTCFAAAGRYVLAHPDHLYVEGFGFGPPVPGLAIHHAWVVSPEGALIDLVWDKPQECEYFGAPFTAYEFATQTGDTWGLLQHVVSEPGFALQPEGS